MGLAGDALINANTTTGAMVMSTTQKAKSVLLLLVVMVLQLLSFFCHYAVVVVASSAFILLSVAHNIYCDALSFNVRFGWVEDATSATHTHSADEETS